LIADLFLCKAVAPSLLDSAQTSSHLSLSFESSIHRPSVFRDWSCCLEYCCFIITFHNHCRRVQQRQLNMPSHRTLAGTLLSCLTLAHSSPLGHATQRDNHKQDIQTLSNSRANAVKEAFLFAWTGYETYAFPNDELEPVNNSFSNSRNGWGASAIDALDTAIVMELPDVVTTILDHVPSIDFSHSKDDSLHWRDDCRL
jgi:hypothetical protein